MKGVSFVSNEKNEKYAVQIELKTLQENRNDVEDFLDGILAESRKDEERVDLTTVIDTLQKAGKLK